jgi:4-hydroxybenzoate polyprenyltransferase
MTMGEQNLSLLKRLWIYQSERIPLFKTSILLAVFSSASINVSALLSGRAYPSWGAYFTAFLVSLIIFMQLRACDEFKDGPDDYKYRPERPIPRGLVSLKTILTIGFGLIPVGLIVSFLYHPPLVFLLLLVWLWLGLMTAEFFVPEWLKSKPVLYMISHMAIMPLLDLFVTGAEWLPAIGSPAPALMLFLGLSFVNGCVLEIGRKIWAPQSERAGVETYSALWGVKKSIMIWLAMMVAAFALLCGVGFATGYFLATAIPCTIMLATCVYAGLSMRNEPTLKCQKWMDTISGLWVFVCYVAAGFAPVAMRYFS